MKPEQAVDALIASLGWEDEELSSTPDRFAGLLREFTPGEVPSVSLFDHDGTDIVVLEDLPFYSLCVHHLVPFFGHATVAYVPSGKVAGLSCIARSLRHFARQPQLQERIATQLADRLHDVLGAEGLVVRLSARQMCMEMRGAESTGMVHVTASRGRVTEALRVASLG
ncbi:MAG: GTP cyclohydrolase I [Proteobacteria bacterium]|nr:GTP cyclohydrolase I [Pseudomonadota bacterium]